MEKEFSSTVKIRFADCDPIGHLNNVKYLEYMLNAREDHVEENYGFTYEQYTRETGCTWVTIQNEIAYLKEVRYNSTVEITSKTIFVDDITAIVELLMKDENGVVHAVFWLTVIYFNMKTRRAEKMPDATLEKFSQFLVEIEHKTFKKRVGYLRLQNKSK
ncbi:acyl-CoA thioesterase [Epilithonimonas hungarica]|jgi:Predicted thioesterase|uniref:Acyl-CoA thioester hydrolase n=1 Tax=Epilithonimonas hungarica TaxID=454006 RepID=A0A1G7G3Z7_9FLAO|nr:acyl-CoA thioesterase [Epilithonimonas hungarica]MPT30710.1 acyl-CoA thioesterase [Chryseobacterium sp.]SDE82795.1 acyl-CoA thioester hydrolase [Epilithonimonas hungarica]